MFHRRFTLHIDAKASSDPLIKTCETLLHISFPEVVTPATNDSIKSWNDPVHRPRLLSARHFPDSVLESSQGFLSRALVAPGYEFIAQKCETSTEIGDFRLLRMKREIEVILYYFPDHLQRPLGFAFRPCENHKVISIPHQTIPTPCHLRIKMVQIDVC